MYVRILINVSRDNKITSKREMCESLMRKSLNLTNKIVMILGIIL
jgi:hypothetical protein